MKKPIKYWLIAMAVLLALGLVLTFVGGVLLNGDIWNARRIMHWGPFNVWGFDHRWIPHKYYNEYEYDHGKIYASNNIDVVQSVPEDGNVITGLDLEMAGVEEIYLELGDHFGLETKHCDSTPKSRVEHGVWKIEQREYRGGGQVWITLPRDIQLKEVELSLAGGQLFVNDIVMEQLDIEMAAGIMELKGMQCRELDVDMTAGELNLDGRVLDKADLSLAAGSINLNMPRPEQYEYEISGSVGSVTVDGDELSGFGSHRGGPGGGTRFEIECVAGTVDIEFDDEGGSSNES